MPTCMLEKHYANPYTHTHIYIYAYVYMYVGGHSASQNQRGGVEK